MNKAVLPMIDLYSGKDSETMRLSQMQLRYRPHFWMWGIPVLFALIGAFVSLSDGWMEGALSGLVIGFMGRMPLELFFPLCVFEMFSVGKAQRRRRWISWLLFGVFLFLGYLTALGSKISAMIFMAWWIAFLLGLRIQRQLRCWRREEEWFEVRGVHPDALRELTAIQQRTNRPY